MMCVYLISVWFRHCSQPLMVCGGKLPSKLVATCSVSVCMCVCQWVCVCVHMTADDTRAVYGLLLSANMEPNAGWWGAMFGTNCFSVTTHHVWLIATHNCWSNLPTKLGKSADFVLHTLTLHSDRPISRYCFSIDVGYEAGVHSRLVPLYVSYGQVTCLSDDFSIWPRPPDANYSCGGVGGTK